jgi:hypothetical protein
MVKVVRMIGAALIAAMGGGCFGNNAQYVERSDTITLSAGNAKEVNAAQHIPDPWPPRVGDRRIPVNGERAVGAIERYEGRGSARGQAGQPAGQPGMTPPPIAPSSSSGTPPATLPY